LDLLPTLATVLVTVSVVYSFQMVIASTNLILQIVLSFVIGLLTMLFISERTNLTPYLHIKELILEQIKK
jgi:hypothetical protein